MADNGATQKIERASEHVIELNKLFRETPPFSYVLEGNTQTGERATFAKKNEAALSRAALICGDAVHNLRSALDHVYWEIVSPFATSDRERKSVQFPFTEAAARLDEAFKRALADRVSPSFVQALHDLKPHGDLGGNQFLYMIHKLDILDKHKILIPTANYTKMSNERIRAEIPEFPLGIQLNGSFGQSKRDLVWRVPPMSRQVRRAQGLVSGKFEKEVNIPVDVFFPITESPDASLIFPTLYKMIDAVVLAVETMRKA